jgi:hypothetical protein
MPYLGQLRYILNSITYLKINAKREGKWESNYHGSVQSGSKNWKHFAQFREDGTAIDEHSRCLGIRVSIGRTEVEAEDKMPIAVFE